MIKRKQLQHFPLLLFLVMGQGCAELTTLGNNDEIAKYAESVFRRQNAVTSRIMMSTDENLAGDGRLHEAEVAMYDACRLLNEYSSRENQWRADGGDVQTSG
ncbi:hypothetical protein [Methylomarinum vadi]|uniref:hypothetical protein n=1 Tax=Methylomarinum vadi TaxID=438855 RepID=UPI0004DF77E1|nr:hypothetical protein [Methylomarinum vadi]